MSSESPDTEWVVHGERSLYESSWLRLNLVDVEMPDGTRFEHHVVRMQRVAVATVLDDGGENVLMIKRHRFIDGSWGWELPIGIVEPSEESISAALREVEEETGWRPSALEHVLTFQPTIGIADTPHDVFRGRGAVRFGEPSEKNEAEETRWVPLASILDLVHDGSIRDGASLVAVLHLVSSSRAL